MVIRVPEKKYIQALIIGKLNASLVVDDLNSRRIAITNGMKQIYAQLVAENPVYFQKDNTDEPDPDWVKSLGVAPMYYYRFKKSTDISLQGCEGAFRMLEDPKVVKYINTLCIAGVNRTDVELILNAKYNISYESPDFDTYIEYFANYDGWSYNDKELYINNEVQDAELKALYKLAMTGERSRLIWELGLGTDPGASFDDMLQDMFTDSYFYFKKKLKFAPDDAQKFAQLAIKLADRMDQIKDKSREQTDLFSELKFKLEEESTSKKDTKSQVVDIADMDAIIPERTEGKITDLSALMNGGPEPQRNVFDE
jgi:hypothetical protein